CLCSALVQQGQAHLSEDRSEHPCRPAPGACTCRARPAPAQVDGLSVGLPRRAWRLPRPAQLPKPRLKPAQLPVEIEPFRRIYDLRHTFATFALNWGRRELGRAESDKDHSLREWSRWTRPQ